MTVGKAGPRRPTASGCGSSGPGPSVPSKPAKPAKPAATGWKAKTETGKSGKTTGLSERAKKELAKTKGGGRGRVSTGCGNSEPAPLSKPAKPAKPAPAPWPPERTGC